MFPSSITVLFLYFILSQVAQAAPSPQTSNIDKPSMSVGSGNAASGPGGQASGGSSPGSPRLLLDLVNLNSNNGGDGGVAISGHAGPPTQRLSTSRKGRCRISVGSDNFSTGPGGQAQGGNGQAFGLINIGSGNGGPGGIASSGGIIRGLHRV